MIRSCSTTQLTEDERLIRDKPARAYAQDKAVAAGH